MKRIGLVFASGALVFGMAWAQPSRAQSDYSTKETRALMHAYAKCVVKRQGRRASQAIVANADNGTILRDYKMLIVDACLSREVATTTEMRFSGDLYRYALADALVNAELALGDAPDLTPVPRLAHREPGEAPTTVTPRGKKIGKRKYEEAITDYRQTVAYLFLSKYGECVARLSPAAARALLLAAPDSSEEATRFQALRPALESCMPEGETLKFGKVALRGTIAINYYRLAKAASTPPPKAGA